MTKKVDKDQNFMQSEWGTNYLLCEYGLESKIKPKKHDFMVQNEIHSKIRNDDDYDDWEYGTEPIYACRNPHK
jgi:hypothetical protein